jgi:hypothetical protein
MTDLQILAFIIVPLAGAAFAWGVVWLTGLTDAPRSRGPDR